MIAVQVLDVHTFNGSLRYAHIAQPKWAQKATVNEPGMPIAAHERIGIVVDRRLRPSVAGANELNGKVHTKS